MVRPHGKDLVSRTPLAELRQKALFHGITIPITDKRDVVGAKTFMAIKGIVLLGNIPLVHVKGKTHYRDPIKTIKQRLYEQVSGTGTAGVFLQCLTKVESRDALVTMCVILDSEEVLLHDLSKSAMDTKFANAQDRFRIGNNLWRVAYHGYSDKQSPNFILPYLLPRLRTSPASIDHTRFESKIPTEIRFAIYDYLIEGRIVKVHLYKGVVKTTCPMPAVLHLSPESRAYAINKYTKLNKYQYFHTELDTLAIGSRFTTFNYDGEQQGTGGYIGGLLRALPLKITQDLTKIALARNSFAVDDRTPHDIGALHAFPALKALTWIHAERLYFEPHHVLFKAASDIEMDLLLATEAELVVAFHDAGNNNMMDGGFVIDEVDEELFGV